MRKILLLALLIIIVCLGVTCIEVKTSLALESKQEIEFTTDLHQAEQGNAYAQANLGWRYAGGHGTLQDYVQAHKWFNLSATQGNAYAQFNLGAMFGGGKGVLQDHTKAKYWYEKAAAQGNADAQYSLGTIYEAGRGVLQDYLQAKKWYEKAAVQDNTYAQMQLGFLYSNGDGFPQDYMQAHKWLNLASREITYAGERRDALAKRMTPEKIAEAQSLAREWKPKIKRNFFDQFDESFSNKKNSQKPVSTTKLQDIDSWPLWAILFLSLLVTWGIGLTPPLLIRYVFLKRPINNKGSAILICVLFFILNFIVFAVLSDGKANLVVLLPIVCVSYFILRKSPTEKLVEKEEKTPNKLKYKIIPSIFYFVIASCISMALALASGLSSGKVVAPLDMMVFLISFFYFITVGRLAIWSKTKWVKGVWGTPRWKRLTFIPCAIIVAHIWFLMASLTHALITDYMLTNNNELLVYAIISRIFFEGILGIGGGIWLIYTLSKYFGFKPLPSVKKSVDCSQ